VKANLLRQRLAEGRLAVGHMVMEFATRGVAKLFSAPPAPATFARCRRIRAQPAR